MGTQYNRLFCYRKVQYRLCLTQRLNPDGKYTNNTQSIVGSIIFRTAEAYLNYIEAYYELHGSLDSYAEKYWKAIRRRAGIDEDYTNNQAYRYVKRSRN